MAKMDARAVALEALLRVEMNKSYSNIVLNKLLQQYQLSGREASLASALFYGVLEKRITLDYVISQFSKIKCKKMSNIVLEILRMGVYQILFMDKIPDSAAVNAAVDLSKQKKVVKASGFINAVLRNLIRAQAHICWPDPQQDPLLYWSVLYSCPLWLVQHFISAYGRNITEKILVALEAHSPLYIRANTTKGSVVSIEEDLNQLSVKASGITAVPGALSLTNSGAIEQNFCYQNGLFHVQDLSSQLCCLLLAPKSGETIVDVCAAPGGKSFTMAELMENQGKIYAFDQSPAKVRLIEAGAERLGLSIIQAGVRDAQHDLEFAVQADRVLCDAPCSGLGIIRRKPEIRYKDKKFLADFPALQYEILCNSARLVKKGGLLFYSTCTLNPEENGAVAERFLREHPDYAAAGLDLPKGWRRGIEEPANQWTLFPCLNGPDGFFMAAFRRS